MPPPHLTRPLLPSCPLPALPSLDVAYAVPDQYLQLADTTPNDPDFDQQWGLQRIGAPAAWDVSTGSAAAGRQPSGVTVCVVDSGVGTSHPDLQGNLHPAVDCALSTVLAMQQSAPVQQSSPSPVQRPSP